MGGRGRDYGHNYETPPPISGQKRGYPFPGRDGTSPDHSDGVKFAKLFVGSVPSTVTEEDIRPLFEEHGNVIEVALIRDKRTGHQRGCCFIKFATSQEADRAIRALHNQYTLPGGLGPLQVRYADGERERLGAVEYKLFVGSLNKQATVQEVEEIFTPYGQVDDVYLMRDDMRQSRGCGFVKYAQRDMALAAINALNGIYTMRGCDQPLTVKFADPKRPRPGESRGMPTFSSPGVGPRFQSPGSRPPPSFNESSGDRAPGSAWNPMSMQDQGPLSSIGNRGYMNQFPSNAATSPINPNAPIPTPGGPNHGLRPASMALPSLPQQSFNPPFQISPSQKPLQSPPPQFPPSVKLQAQSTASYSQAQTSYSQLGPEGPIQSPNFPTSFHQPLPAQAIMDPSRQAATSSAISFQAPPSTDAQSQTRPSMPIQPHQFPQPTLQSPSPLAQMLSQQTQALRASFQSSQQAFSQLQQQLQMMQPSNQGAASQQWVNNNGQANTNTSAATQAVEGPPSSSAAPAPVAPVTTAAVGAVKRSWTEHTSPDGFKYYYNGVTGESRWVEPEELKQSKQQQQQQLQQQKPPQMQPQPAQHLLQPYPPSQPQQPQMQAQPQMQFPQQPAQQQSFTSSYQASGAPGHQNVQELGYPQYRVTAHPGNDPARFQQGLQASQEWMWKNKQPTAPEELT